MKKYRIKKKNVCILAGIILVIVYLIVNPLELIAKSKLKKLNYSDNAIKYIIKKGVKNSTLSHEYSEFVDKTIDQKDFNIEYYDKYLDLKFFEKSNDIVLVNKLIETGYSVDDRRGIKTRNIIDINGQFHARDHELNADTKSRKFLGVGIFTYSVKGNEVITHSYAYHEGEGRVIGIEKVMPKEWED